MGNVLKIISGLSFLGLLGVTVFDFDFYCYLQDHVTLLLLILSVIANILFMGLLFESNEIGVDVIEIKRDITELKDRK